MAMLTYLLIDRPECKEKVKMQVNGKEVWIKGGELRTILTLGARHKCKK